eukprot:TRINITY_DN6518_c0_g1_i1.p2 TRINITY_DN6518_c0_g1~~TRINITY_DN6518_c0_g1_i1.p2  ORF type:complete len:111 (-),score=14.11 TRINITY_DN6518_c0_g1_i1:321-653(-)
MKPILKEKELKYSLLQVVFGKVKGYKKWPGLIMGRSPAAKKPYCVYFVEDDTSAYLTEHDIEPFSLADTDAAGCKKKENYKLPTIMLQSYIRMRFLLMNILLNFRISLFH